MTIVTEKTDKAWIVQLQGRLDATAVADFNKELEGILSQENVNLVFDLKQLEYISSAGLRSFLVVAKALKGKGGRMVVCQVLGVVKEVFAVSGFSTILNIVDTREEAVESIP